MSPTLRLTKATPLLQTTFRQSLSQTTRTLPGRWASTASKPVPERAAADWALHGKRIAGQAAIYFPFYTVVLGWPLAAKWAIDWSRGL